MRECSVDVWTSSRMQHDKPRLSNLTLPAQYFSDRDKDNELSSIDLYLFVLEILLIIVLLLITIVRRLRRVNNNFTTAAAVDVSDAATTTTHSAVTAPQ